MTVVKVTHQLLENRQAALTIEVEDERQAMTALNNGADIIMLDNFQPNEALRLARKLKRLRPTVLMELSGGIMT